MQRLTLLAIAMFSCLLWAGIAAAQTPQDAPCQLTNFRDAQTITIRGVVSSAPHDMTFVVPGCHNAVVLLYAGDDGSGLPADELQRDNNLEDFRRYTTATYKGSRKNLCMQCPKYEVQATLVGKLSVAPDTIPEGLWKDNLGMLHDKSGKLVGQAGFGHPPVYRYCIAIKSVSVLTARKLPKPAVSTP